MRGLRILKRKRGRLTSAPHATGRDEQHHGHIGPLVLGIARPAYQAVEHVTQDARIFTNARKSGCHFRNSLVTKHNKHIAAPHGTIGARTKARHDAKRRHAVIAEITLLQRSRRRMHDEARNPRSIADAAYGAATIRKGAIRQNKARKLFVADASVLFHHVKQGAAGRRVVIHSGRLLSLGLLKSNLSD